MSAKLAIWALLMPENMALGAAKTRCDNCFSIVAIKTNSFAKLLNDF